MCVGQITRERLNETPFSIIEAKIKIPEEKLEEEEEAEEDMEKEKKKKNP